MSLHYHRKPLVLVIPKAIRTALEQRFKCYVQSFDKYPDDCWHWTGGRDPKGYGRFKLGQGFNGHSKSTVMAHRMAYTLYVAPIPEDMTVDHTCNNPWCVNPRHLEPVTWEENERRKQARRTIWLQPTVDVPF